MDKETVINAGKDIIFKHVGDVIKKKIPIFGEIIESYESYKKAVDEKLLKNFLNILDAKVKNLQLKFDEDWVNSEEGQKFCHKVMAAALNAEYADKQKLFANALINGTVVSSVESAEKFKFTDTLRHLSRPALDVLAFMYGMKDRIGGHGTTELAVQVLNSSADKGELQGMGYYLIYSCLVEIKTVGLFSSATSISQNSRGQCSVTGRYHNVETYTPFTERFIEFVTEKTQK